MSEPSEDFGDEDVRRGVGYALVAELVEESEVVVAGLVDADLGAQAELADEGSRAGAAFFEDIGEGPEGHHVDQCRRIGGRCWRAQGRHRWCRVTSSCRARSTPSRTAAGGLAGGLHLAAHFGDGAADAVVHGRSWAPRSSAEHVFDGVVGVAVAGDEVDGDFVVGRVLEKVVDPRGGRGGRAADAQARADGFEVAWRCGRRARSSSAACGTPPQKSMLGSFQTSKYHCETSSMP